MNGIQENLMLEYAPDVIVPIGTEKRCPKCVSVKTINDFHKRKDSIDGRHYQCKECENKYYKKWKLRNKKHCAQYNREYYILNKEDEDTRSSKWRKEHPEQMKIRARKARIKARMSPIKKLIFNMRNGLWKTINNNKNGRHWETLVGYTADQLKRHLEKLFKSGMTWENYGSYWWIDHKIPISAFNFERPEDIDFKRCWSLRNLQPLEAKQNRVKHDKVDKPFQPSLII